MISPQHIINARKKKLEDFEAVIDKSLEAHFKETSGFCSIPLNNVDITKNEINELVMKYHNGGWVVSHEEGCDDRPCGSCWNYLKFSLPDKITTFG